MRWIALFCVFAAHCFAQSASTASILDRLEGRQGKANAGEIAALSRALQADLGGGGTIGPQHRVLIGRASNYLTRVQADPNLDPSVGLAAAGAWQRMAMAQDSNGSGPAADPNGALLGYRNAYLLNSRYGGQGGDMGYLGGRIRALGGSVPGWISVDAMPQESLSSNEWGGMPLRPPVNAPSGPLAQLPPFPKVDPLSLSPEGAKQYKILEERYTSVAASVYTARSSTEAIRLSVQSRGLAIHPETEQMLVRMDLSMSGALRAIESQRWDDARQQLDAAAEYSSRLLKIGGR